MFALIMLQVSTVVSQGTVWSAYSFSASEEYVLECVLPPGRDRNL